MYRELIVKGFFHFNSDYSPSTDEGVSTALFIHRGTYNGNILSPDGYITIKIGGTDKTIPYYST